jgi:hypothetical protein
MLSSHLSPPRRARLVSVSGRQRNSGLPGVETITAQPQITLHFSGFLLTVIRDCPAFGTYFASYEWLVRRLSVDGKPESLTVWQLLFAGGTAGTLSWLVNYPTDVLKTRFQADGIDAHNIAYRSIRECIVKTYREDGYVWCRGCCSVDFKNKEENRRIQVRCLHICF